MEEVDMIKKGPDMLKGTLTRHEREAAAIEAAAHKKRRTRARIIGVLIGIVVVIVIAIGAIIGLNLTHNHNKAAVSQATSKVVTKSATTSSMASSSSQVQPSNLFGDAATEISPEKYIKEIYGKTDALYLIVGDSKDPRTQQLAQAFKDDHNTLHAQVPVYFIDANSFLQGNDAKEKIATLQLLNGLGLAKVTGKSVPSEVKFTSTMYANKLTDVDGKKAYTSYTADENTFTDRNALQAFLSAANDKLGIK